MQKSTLRLFLHLLILSTQQSVTFSEDVSDPRSIKCGECPCVSQCSPQLPLPTPPSLPTPQLPYLAPPPPRFVYMTELSPPPPPMPGDMYGSSNPYDWQIYSRAALRVTCYKIEVSLCFMVVVFSAFRLL